MRCVSISCVQHSVSGDYRGAADKGWTCEALPHLVIYPIQLFIVVIFSMGCNETSVSLHTGHRGSRLRPECVGAQEIFQAAAVEFDSIY